MLVADAPLIDPALEPIRERVLAGERLGYDDGVALYRTRDLFTLGELANVVRERLHGRNVYYNINRHINYTNYCVLRCKFCAFYRALDGKSGLTELSNTAGYAYSLDEIVEIAADAERAGATEVHIVGGLHPKLPFEFYTDLCRAIRQRCPGLHIKAFTAIEIIHFTRISKPRRSIHDVLIALREAGLDSLPGGGAEIFDERVHAEVFKNKVGEQGWFDVHRAAHALGIPTNATMLYGHVETPEERIRHLIKLREHQDESLGRMRSNACGVQRESGSSKDEGRTKTPPEATGAIDAALQAPRSAPAPQAAFQCCIPLSFIPDGSALAHLPGPTGLDDLRTLAIARLMLDNVPHIKAFWIMQSPKLSQVALSWGVDDFDGTVVWYDITKREGHGTNRQELSVEQIRRLIREAGGVPIERDTLYRAVRRDDAGRVIRG
ncbi:MAG: radical SAM protein [Phycisphaerae bacterium]